MVQRILITLFALWWFIQSVTMFRCTSVIFDGMSTTCFDTPAGAAESGYFVGWEAGLVVLVLTGAALSWMWIVPKVRMVRAQRAAQGEEAIAEHSPVE
jgi:hypothetical protein